MITIEQYQNDPCQFRLLCFVRFNHFQERLETIYIDLSISDARVLNYVNYVHAITRGRLWPFQCTLHSSCAVQFFRSVDDVYSSSYIFNKHDIEIVSHLPYFVHIKNVNRANDTTSAHLHPKSFQSLFES